MSKKKKRKDPGNEQFRKNILALVSHELNTPLTGILNALTVLEERFDENDEYVSMLRRNSERLQKAVQNMMELSYADAGSLRVRLTETNLEHVILFQLEELKDELNQAGFKPVVLIEQDVPTVCADAKRIGRVFHTLISNAVKFSRQDEAGSKKKNVQILLSMQTDDVIPTSVKRPQLAQKTALYMVAEIKSTLPSVGDRPESPEAIFEAFTPWKDVDTREKEGLGVELALAREIVMAHQGMIWAHLPADAGKPWSMKLALPVLSREDELAEVIANRLLTGSNMHTKVSVLLLKPNFDRPTAEDDLRALEKRTRELLFRSSDSVFSIPEIGELTIIMDDCDATGCDKVARRLVAEVHKRLPNIEFQWAHATGPEDGTSAETLLQAARANWINL